jgi:hypothetical protein
MGFRALYVIEASLQVVAGDEARRLSPVAPPAGPGIKKDPPMMRIVLMKTLLKEIILNLLPFQVPPSAGLCEQAIRY